LGSGERVEGKRGKGWRREEERCGVRWTLSNISCFVEVRSQNQAIGPYPLHPFITHSVLTFIFFDKQN
jgi:hypothetical protein